MTHRVHPYIFRIGQLTTWQSRWFSKKKFAEYLKEDTLLREWLLKKLRNAHIKSLEIERSPNIMTLTLKTSRPGILIGRGGEGAEKLKKEIEKKLLSIWKGRLPEKREIKLNIEEVKSPEVNSAIVAQVMAEDLEKRIPFRRVMKQMLEKVSSHKEVKGVKIAIKGRLDGAEMARYEWLKSGRIPLQTMRSNIDYATATAHTTYGTIGIKIWIYKGDVFGDIKQAA